MEIFYYNDVIIFQNYDEVKYPEKYRKKLTKDDGSISQEEPFDVGYISKIFSKKLDDKKTQEISLLVKKFYRPHNTHLERKEADRMLFNTLYWSEEGMQLKH